MSDCKFYGHHLCEVQITFPRKIVLHLIWRPASIDWSSDQPIGRTPTGPSFFWQTAHWLMIWLLLPGQLRKNSVQFLKLFSKFSKFSAWLPPKSFNSNCVFRPALGCLSYTCISYHDTFHVLSGSFIPYYILQQYS